MTGGSALISRLVQTSSSFSIVSRLFASRNVDGKFPIYSSQKSSQVENHDLERTRRWCARVYTGCLGCDRTVALKRGARGRWGSWTRGLKMERGERALLFLFEHGPELSSCGIDRKSSFLIEN